jgi:hypothetical protein
VSRFPFASYVKDVVAPAFVRDVRVSIPVVPSSYV